MQLNYIGIQDTAAWEKAGVKLPKHDWKAMCAETEQNPVWVHFGAGNIFRIFVAGLMQRLLDAGESKAGIVAVETFDREVVDRIYVPHDSMTLAVSLLADGGIDKSVVASIAGGVVVGDADGWTILDETVNSDLAELRGGLSAAAIGLIREKETEKVELMPAMRNWIVGKDYVVVGFELWMPRLKLGEFDE